MIHKLIFIFFVLTFSLVAEEIKNKSVKVAAIQADTQIGKLNHNRKLLTRLITEAAKNNAKIIVVPECAVQGYMDLETDTIWAVDAVAADNEMSIEKGAEPIEGPSIKYFSDLAKKLQIYLCLGFAEKVEDKKNHKTFYFNSQVLINPTGKIIAHHRKKNLWPPGDSRWADEGKKEIQVVDTEYGRLGLMICFDLHVLPPELAKKKADIVLYSVGWFGPNEKNWFQIRFPRDYVKPYNFFLILANWSAGEDVEPWPGAGFSTIYGPDGSIISKAKDIKGSEIIYADIPVHQKTAIKTKTPKP